MLRKVKEKIEKSEKFINNDNFEKYHLRGETDARNKDRILSELKTPQINVLEGVSNADNSHWYDFQNTFM